MTKLERAKKYIEEFEDVAIIVGYAGNFKQPAHILLVTPHSTYKFIIGASSWFWGRLNNEKKEQFKSRMIKDIKSMSELLDEFKKTEMFIAFIDKNSKRLFEFAMKEFKENKIYENL